MSRKQPYVKLCLGPAGVKAKRKSSILGGTVISDFVSPIDNHRYVVIECAKATAEAKAPEGVPDV